MGCSKGVALPRPFGWSEKLETYFKINHAKISNRFHALFFQRKMGVALSCPFGQSDIFGEKNSLGTCLLDTKEIMQK